ncbi:MAG: glycosyltransferase family 39 protein [Bacteroidales bacterium]|jgi:hypothetical protein|nr:glycosyltransferase family 39 protein [Bacteroidales bacterium]
MKDLYKNLSAIIIIVFIGLIFNYKYLNTFPYQIHAWTQSDRLAIALGFVENDLNFFKPQTFVYYYQFPELWHDYPETTITAADFPIHDFIPAIFMKLFKSNDVIFFRIYILLYGFMGLFFLFKLSQIWTKNYFKSLIILLLAATSPVFVYYQGGFLPTIPSLSNAIIGVYFYSLYIENSRNKNFNISLIFFTLAALSRLTFIIPLIAVYCVEFIRIIKNNSKLLPKVAPVIISTLFIALNFIYNKILKDNYGSIFLSQLMPADNFAEFFSLIKLTAENWLFDYFTKIHYLIFAGIILLSVFGFLIRKINSKQSYFILYILTIFIGSIMFLIALIRQFPAHDYYFLDTFFLPIILLIIFLISIIPDFQNKKISNGFWLILFLVIAYPLSSKAIASQDGRYEEKDWSRAEKTYKSFIDSKNLLSELNIPNDSKILIIDCPTPNIPFILMGRKGFVVRKYDEGKIKLALDSLNYDYIILQNEYYLSRIYQKYSDIIYRINKIGGNDKISVFTLADNPQEPVFEMFADYENELHQLWKNTFSTSEVSYSGSHSGLLAQDMLYGLTFKTKDLSVLSEKNNFIFFKAKFMCQYITDCHLVLSIIHNNENIYYKNYSLEEALSCSQEWEDLSVGFEVPKLDVDDYEFAIYLYNPGKSRVYVDDFWFGIY